MSHDEILLTEADNMDHEIDLNAKRLARYGKRRYKVRGSKAKKCQSLLRIMADRYQKGTLPIILDGITSRHILTTILKSTTYPQATYYYLERKHLQMADLADTELLQYAKSELEKLLDEGT